MDVNKSRGLDLLPGATPPGELLGRFQDPRFEAYIAHTFENPRQRLAILWTIALENAFESRELHRDFRGFRFASYGFADPEFEGDAFGVLVYTNPSVPPQRHWLDLRDYKFPIFTRPSYEELHVNPPQVHPADGTTACWARSGRADIDGVVGLLTAKHVVEPPPILGSQVQTTHGPGTLIDIGPEGIDAALIEPPAGTQPGGQPLSCQNLVAQWSDATIHGRHGRVDTKVVEVTSARGGLNHHIPIQIFLAYPAQPGDSGSLVTDASGRGVGIYRGGIVNTATQHMEGFCQHLGQAAHALNLELFT